VVTIQDHVLDAYRRLEVVIAGVTDAQVREPSVLPDWTRGHVLAHIAGATAALARQAEHEGTLVEVYEGGRPARNADIETNASRTADEHRAAISAAVQRLTAAWAGVRDWSTPCAYRDGTLADTASALWREAEIHTFDLDLGPVEFSPEFCASATDFLAQRVPDGVELTLVADDGTTRTIGSGTPVELRGSSQDLTLWLAGREPVGKLVGEPPALNPWP
jgi:maleylpyruvate isomerase